MALVDSSGNVQTQYTYEPFGRVSTNGPANSNSQKYTNREDDGTGQYYYRSRYYSPALQRFTGEDRIGLAGGINLYAYVDGDPVDFTDSFGESKDCGCGGSVVELWFRVSDVRAAQDWWNGFHNEQIQKGNWAAATGGDILNKLLTMSELAEVQSDGEVLGSDASTFRKVTAGLDLIRIGATWYFLLTGDEIVPKDPKTCRIAPLGNRTWTTNWARTKKWEKIGINQLPHYHRRIPHPSGKGTAWGGSIDWHRPWEKGF